MILDHIVVRVDNLERAVAEWGRRFEVVPGGRHDTGSHNALIAFADGSYLELLGFPQPTPTHPWWHLPAGLIDFCIGTSNLDEALQRINIQMQAPFEMTRQRPDGYLLRWRLAFPEPTLQGRFPFIIEDITPRIERVPAAGPAAPSLSRLVVYDPEPIDIGVPGIEVRRSPVRRLQAILSDDSIIE